ncbi:MAG: DNA primase, partial [Roseburia sp.]|nr:DNA primase [Roseburia sp.]
MARIPDSFLETLRQSSDIVSVISSYVEVKRTGRDYVCSCPFHSERTPSCHIYTESQSFYCFGCGAGGDVINFIRLIERLDYVESVRFLAQRAGLSMPEDPIDDGGANRRARMLEMNREAARYFRDVLLSPEGREGLDYLVGRGLIPNTIRRYGLGFAPDGWHNLHYHLRGKGYSDDEMLSGALLARRNNSVYDKFRRRVMFPIIDRRGNVIAFGGRALEKDAPAKYLNSDETLVFQKRENLFSLNFAKNTKEKCLILCEGYMDVIALNQAGFDNAVATLGTAITPQQANLMKRYTSEVVISYDSDEAGQTATVKAINLLSEAGVTARVLKIPDAKDPDEYIKNFGAEQFRTILAGAGSAVDHEFKKLSNGIDLSAAEGKAAFLKKAVPFLASLRSDTERIVYIAEAARLTGQQASALREVVEERRKKDRFYERRDEERRIIRGTGGGAGSPA